MTISWPFDISIFSNVTIRLVIGSLSAYSICLFLPHKGGGGSWCYPSSIAAHWFSFGFIYVSCKIPLSRCLHVPTFTSLSIYILPSKLHSHARACILDVLGPIVAQMHFLQQYSWFLATGRKQKYLLQRLTLTNTLTSTSKNALAPCGGQFTAIYFQK